MNIRLLYAIALVLTSCIFKSKSATQNDRKRIIEKQQTYYSPGGTYSDWYFPPGKGYTSLEWTFVPVADPPQTLAREGLLHYYAYNFSLQNSTASVGGGYAGFQTSGIFRGRHKGKVINFSIWGSNGGKTIGLLNARNRESGGFQIMYKYNWVIGHHYRFELKEGPGGLDSLGKWWGLWITDQNTAVKDFVGEQRVPSIINGRSSVLWTSHTSMFGEDLHWWKSFNGRKKFKDCLDFECSAMAAIEISANGGTVKPVGLVTSHNSGQVVTHSNGFKSINCNVSLYQDSTQINVQHNLGYWSTPAPNFLNKINQ
jgi:hypothetical protein